MLTVEYFHRLIVLGVGNGVGAGVCAINSLLNAVSLNAEPVKDKLPVNMERCGQIDGYRMPSQPVRMAKVVITEIELNGLVGNG